MEEAGGSLERMLTHAGWDKRAWPYDIIIVCCLSLFYLPVCSDCLLPDILLSNSQHTDVMKLRQENKPDLRASTHFIDCKMFEQILT